MERAHQMPGRTLGYSPLSVMKAITIRWLDAAVPDVSASAKVSQIAGVKAALAAKEQGGN